MNTILILSSLIVVYEAAHYGVQRAGESFVADFLENVIIGASTAAEVMWLFLDFIIWIFQLYTLISLVQLIAVDFTDNGRLEITNFNLAAKLFLASVALNFVKGIRKSFEEKSKVRSKTEPKYGE